MKNRVIEINGRFAFQRDTYGWTLFDKTATKDGPRKKNNYGCAKTFHADLGQVCKEAIDRGAGSLGSLQEIIEMLGDAKRGLLVGVDQLNIDNNDESLSDWIDKEINE